MTTPIWDTLEAAASSLKAPQPTSSSEAHQVLELPLDLVHPDPNQPRSVSDPENDPEIQELAESIRSLGFILEPILVEPDPDRHGEWRIIAGERRFHASRLAGQATIRSLPFEGLEDSQRLIIQLIENLHRKGLNLAQRARAYARLKDLTGLKAKDLAKRLGISESSFSAHLRVLKATGVLEEAVTAGVVSNTETYRLLSELPSAHQERVVRDALRERAPLSRPALERLRDRLLSQAERKLDEAPPPGAKQGRDEKTPVAVGLSLPQWRRLFTLLNLTFPEDPEGLAATLFELLGEET